MHRHYLSFRIVLIIICFAFYGCKKDENYKQEIIRNSKAKFLKEFKNLHHRKDYLAIVDWNNYRLVENAYSKIYIFSFNNESIGVNSYYYYSVDSDNNISAFVRIATAILNYDNIVGIIKTRPDSLVQIYSTGKFGISTFNVSGKNGRLMSLNGGIRDNKISLGGWEGISYCNNCHNGIPLNDVIITAPGNPDPTWNPFPVVPPGPGGGTGSTSSVGNFIIDKSTQDKYPKFTDLIKRLESFVANDKKVMDALIKWSGYNREQILEKVKFGQGPTITVKELTGKYGYFDRAENPDVINIDASWVRGLETANLLETQEATGFLLAVTALHEFVHQSRAANGLDRNYEYGYGFEQSAFGLIIENDGAAPYNYRFRLYKK